MNEVPVEANPAGGDDTHDIAKALRRLGLQKTGLCHSPTAGADGAGALLRLENGQQDASGPRLPMLPSVDGLEICRRIRQMTYATCR